jgi:hypothetical protein
MGRDARRAGGTKVSGVGYDPLAAGKVLAPLA